MRYILDSDGYIDSVSCNPFGCKDKECQEYTGAVPSGYETLDEWVLNANIRAYKITNNNLVYDEAKDEELQAEWEIESTPIKTLFNGSMGNIGTDYTLTDDITNYDLIIVGGGAEEVYFRSPLVIPVVDIICSSTSQNSYALSTYTSNAHCYINFSFPTSKTIRIIDRSNSGWGTPRLNKVYGIKL